MPLLVAVARSLVSAEPNVEAVVARLTLTLGRPWRWLGPLARRYLNTFAKTSRPRLSRIIHFLETDEGFGRARVRHGRRLAVRSWIADAPRMVSQFDWELPSIESSGALAEWLGLSVTELDWFADLKGLLRKAAIDSRIVHYHCSTLPKPSGGFRAIEAPKPRLKSIQRKILSEILERIPVHPSTHGFVKGRSIQSFASPHVARKVVLRLDLKDYFPSISRTRVQAFFRTARYPENVADLLGGLCTSSRTLRLPQGAPTSPALANLCSYRFDCRLTGLAKAAGLNYTALCGRPCLLR